MKKRFTLISFDLIRTEEPDISYSIATILAYLRADVQISEQYDIDHLSINLYREYESHFITDIDKVIQHLDEKLIQSPDVVALSEYIWSRNLTGPVSAYLKQRFPSVKLILGGPEITPVRVEQISEGYPFADHLISGYAEEALAAILLGKKTDLLITGSPDCNRLVSPYLSKVITIHDQVKMLRWETKRGCPYRCTFCEWSQVAGRKVIELPIERLHEELKLFSTLKNLEKINVLDGTFNTKDSYLTLMDAMGELKGITFSIQTRIEAIKGKNGDKFLENLIRYRNIFPEVGIQTIVPDEMVTIGRVENREQAGREIEEIKRVLLFFRDNRIKYKADLIYGIPGQTKKTFTDSFRFLIDCGTKKSNISTFPLRIPKNSKIKEDDTKIRVYPMFEGCPIDIVKESSSFTAEEWKDINRKSGTMKFEFNAENSGGYGKILLATIPKEFRLVIHSKFGYTRYKKLTIGLQVTVNTPFIRSFFPIVVRWKRVGPKEFQHIILTKSNKILIRDQKSLFSGFEYGVIRSVEKAIDPHVFDLHVDSYPSLDIARQNMGNGALLNFKYIDEKKFFSSEE